MLLFIFHSLIVWLSLSVSSAIRYRFVLVHYYALSFLSTHQLSLSRSRLSVLCCFFLLTAHGVSNSISGLRIVSVRNFTKKCGSHCSEAFMHTWPRSGEASFGRWHCFVLLFLFVLSPLSTPFSRSFFVSFFFKFFRPFGCFPPVWFLRCCEMIPLFSLLLIWRVPQPGNRWYNLKMH